MIAISADAEAALCCSIARKRRADNNMQDLNKADAAIVSVLPCPPSFVRKRYRVSPSECLGINLDAVPTNLKSQTTKARHPTKTVPAPNESSPQMSLHYKYQFSPFYRSLCLLLFCGSQVLRNLIFLDPSLGTEPTSGD